jgi:hypothetical protein
MIHITIPKTAKGEPIPLVKLGQGREDEHESGPLETTQTLAQKLRTAGYQEPVIQPPVPTKDGFVLLKEGQIGGEVYGLKSETLTVIAPPADLPLVSQRGFKAGVFATCLGGAFLGALYFGCGALICGCVASGCVGFVAGMLMTQEWK